MRAARVLLFITACVRAADLTCVSCHKQAAHRQPETLMGRALMLPGSNTVLQTHPKLAWSRGKYSYRVDTDGEHSTYSVTSGPETIAVPIRWGFGARAQTFVVERDGHFYESLVSYYPKIDGLGITIGDERIEPTTLLEAFGRRLADTETKSCFGCHSHGSASGETLRLESLKPGVQCENCHADAKAHLEAFARGKTNVIPRKLGLLTAEETSNSCGQCHRTWDRVVRDRLRGEINVRFQPYRLANSKCYDGQDRRMSCTTCHDPHRDAEEGAAFYDSKCLACHNTGAKVTASKIAKICHTATSGCSTCHMPKVPLPGGMQVFTDHQIRIVRAGEPYPN